MTALMDRDDTTAPCARLEVTLKGFRRPKSTDVARRPENTVIPTRIPRVTRLMALAIKYQEMVSRGELRDYADIARLGHITRARATQVMNLLHLAPDIQDELLFLNVRPACGRITERDLRKIARAVYWQEQRGLWRSRLNAPELSTADLSSIPMR